MSDNKKSRGFLKPTALLVAALMAAGTTVANAQSSGSPDFIIQPATGAVLSPADHTSHVSHASHASHASHSSHVSGSY